MASTLAPPSFTVGSKKAVPRPRATSAEKAREERIARYSKLSSDMIITIGGLTAKYGTVTNRPAFISDGELITSAAKDLAVAAGEGIESSPKIARFLERTGEATPWVAFGIGLAGLGLGIAVNHSPALQERLAHLGGNSAPESE